MSTVQNKEYRIISNIDLYTGMLITIHIRGSQTLACLLAAHNTRHLRNYTTTCFFISTRLARYLHIGFGPLAGGWG
jgi:hypothetical protein